MIRLVALDIDGTLLTPGVDAKALPDGPMTQAVQALHDAGVVVVLATGRMFPGTAHVARHLGITEPLICQQGASVHEFDGTLRHAYAVEEEIALQLVDFAKSHGWSLAWFSPDRYLVTAHSPEAQFFADVSQIEMEIHPAPHRSGVRATGIDIISTREHAGDVHVLMEARYAGRIALLDFPSVTTVHAPEASKGNALRNLAEELGIGQDEVLAIGDSVNDVSMLSWAGHSAAPAHCDRYARESAGEILQGAGVEGVVARLWSVLD
jgi:Cof subfamily protein (haloacid dehalogenase superfamily)